MKKNKISLNSLEYYNGHSSLYKIFEENKIYYVSQILNDKLMQKIYLKLDKPYNYELLGFIDLIKYSYLNIPLITNQFLQHNYKIVINNTDNLSRMGFNPRQKNHLLYTLDKAKQDLIDDMTLYDCFNLLITKYSKILDNNYSAKGIDIIIIKYLENYQNNKNNFIQTSKKR